MKLTKEQVEIIKNSSENSTMRRGYDMTIIELCTDWLEMNNEYTEEANYIKIHHKRISGQFCVSCKWLSRRDKNEGRYCMNKSNNDSFTGCAMNIPDKNFGCNRWEGKDE